MNQLTDSQRETVADLLREAASRDHTQDLPLFGPVPARDHFLGYLTAVILDFGRSVRPVAVQIVDAVDQHLDEDGGLSIDVETLIDRVLDAVEASSGEVS